MTERKKRDLSRRFGVVPVDSDRVAVVDRQYRDIVFLNGSRVFDSAESFNNRIGGDGEWTSKYGSMLRRYALPAVEAWFKQRESRFMLVPLESFAGREHVAIWDRDLKELVSIDGRADFDGVELFDVCCGGEDNWHGSYMETLVTQVRPLLVDYFGEASSEDEADTEEPTVASDPHEAATVEREMLVEGVPVDVMADAAIELWQMACTEWPKYHPSWPKCQPSDFCVVLKRFAEAIVSE